MSMHRHFAQQFPTIYALSAIKNGIIMWNYDIFLCKSLEMLIYTTVIKNDIVEQLEKQPLNFFTVYTLIRKIHSPTPLKNCESMV